MYENDAQMVNPINVWFTTEHAADARVLGALALLWLIGRGFRGVSVGGVNVGVR
jgi:hypothetical protein